jgi:hypothetical protein
VDEDNVAGIELDSVWLPDKYQCEHAFLVPDYGFRVTFTSELGRSLSDKLRRRGKFTPESRRKINPISGPGYTIDSHFVDEDHWEHDIILEEYDATVVLLNDEASGIGNALYYRASHDTAPVVPYFDPIVMERLLQGYSPRDAGIPRGWKHLYIRELKASGMGYKEIIKLLHVSGQTYRDALESDDE